MNKYSQFLGKRGLSLDRLGTLIAIVDSGSMTRAAGGDPSKMALYSRQIKELEAFFGVKLAEHKGRSLLLNENGRRLVRIAREALDGLSGFADACKDLPRELIVGAGNSIIEWWLMPRMEQLQAALPRTPITLLNTRTAEAIERLREMTLDLAIVRKDAITRPLRHKPLFPLEYRLFIPEQLSSGITEQNVTEKLGDLPLATALGGQFRQELARSTERAEVGLRVSIACTSFTQAARAVSKGIAAAILPAIAGLEFRDMRVSSFRLSFLDGYSRPLCIAWHPRREEMHVGLAKAVRLLGQQGQGAISDH